ncbi:MAG: patatin-like phospholipase family protein [Wenzhouxiangella sp.]
MKTPFRLVTVVLVASLALTLSGPVPAGEEPGSPAPSIGLALGSGGATGLAHIAMLETLDSMDIKPTLIAGSSIGAIIGALYASGLSGSEIRKIFDDFSGSEFDMVSELAWGDADLGLSSLLRTDLDNGGLLSSDGLMAFLDAKIEADNFEDLDIPLKIVATEFWTGEERVLDSGELLPAIQASMAVPGLFSPEARDGELLIDGGSVNPLPFDLLTDACDIVIAVDVSGSRTQREPGDTGPTDVIFNSFEIMQQAITAEKMKHIQPDIYIRPDVRDIRLLHFNRIEEILEQAAPAAETMRRELEAALAEK